MPLLVAIITVVAFLPALRAGFVSWDDDKNFLANPNYRGLGAAQLRWMWSTFLLGHYVPLSWMTLGLDYTLWGMNPAGYHLTNVVLHAGNAALLYWITLRVLRAAGAEAGPPATLAAAIGALLFSLHPLRVESVAWITERRDVISGFFYLASVLCYLRAAGSESFRSRYAASLALFVCALLSKGTAVTLPVALVGLNVYPLRRLPGDGWWSAGARRVYAEVLPFALLAAGASALTLVALQQMTQLPATGKVAVSAYSLAFYLYKTVLPLRLSPIYAMPEHVDPTALVYVVSYAAVIVVTIGALFQWKRRPAITVGWLAFVAIMLPMLGIHQNGPQIAADRYTYGAAPVLSLLAAGALLPFAGRSAMTGIVAGVVLAAAGALTWKQTEVWQNSTSLWSRVLALDSASSYGHNNWGNLLLQDGKVDEAQAHYERAVALTPGYAQAHNNLGITFARQGRFDEAIPEYQRALAIEPGYDEPHNNWGIALAHAGQLDSAVAQFRLALSANPDNADAEINWGNALVRAGKPADAIPHYEESLRIRPDNADAYLNWGVALALQARWNEAIAEFQAALRISPDNTEARAYMAEAMRRRGRAE